MANLKEIRRRLTSVANTKQIARAMKLVSAAKLRRAQESAVSGRAFSARLGGVLATVRAQLPENFSNPLLEPRKTVKCRRIIVIAGERGLCGAYNANVIKEVIRKDINTAPSDLEIEVVPIGRRTASLAKQKGWNLVQTLEGLPEVISSWPIAELAETQMRDFIDGKCDEVVLYYTKFNSVINQEITREVLIPFSSEGSNLEASTAPGAPTSEESATPKQSKLDPGPAQIIDQLIPLLVKTKITQAALESKASEHASRMTAMDSATRNADELIDSLRLFYNRARQSAITTELIDIVGGAQAAQ